MLLGASRNARKEVVRHAGWHTPAGGYKLRLLRQRRQFVEHGFPFGAMKRRARQNKAILLSSCFLVRSEVLPSFDVRWSHQAVDALSLHQPMQQLSYRAAGRVDRHDATAKTMRHPRYIDASAARISF